MQSEPIVPVPDDSPNKLPCQWVFWYLIPSKGGQNCHWTEYLHPLHSFETSDGYWKLMNSVERCSNLLKGCRYYVFRDKIKPLWEDPAVVEGKIVSIELEKTEDLSAIIEEKWGEIVSKSISEEFGDNILGLEFNSRTDTWKIATWMRKGCDNITSVVDFYRSVFVEHGDKVVINDVGETN